MDKEINKTTFVRINVNGGANIREKGNMSSKLLLRGKKDDIYIYISQIGDWTKIKTVNGIEGYIYSQYLQEETETNSVFNTVVINVDRANVREFPGVNSKITCVANIGETYSVVGRCNKWLKINLAGGSSGYIFESMVDPIVDSQNVIGSKYEKFYPPYEKCSHERKPQIQKFQFNEKDNTYILDKDYAHNLNGKARIMCVGDIMCEERMFNAYNYDGHFYPHNIFYYVKNIFKKADLVVGNLETMIYEDAPYTGERYKINGKYHCNAPKSYLDALKYAGFDLFMLSNNHNLDCGYDGISATIKNIDREKILHTGLYDDSTEKRYIIIEISGIKIGFLSYSTWFNKNLYRFTEDGKKLLNIYNYEEIKENIRNARKDGAEYIITYIHWGVDSEYKNRPGKSQLKQAIELAEAGADYIIGSHTHSLQIYEEIKNSKGKKVPVIYSLGNFATSERNPISRENMILVLDLERKDNNIVCKSSYIACHVFDNFVGRKYPIVPTIKKFNENNESEYLTKAKSLAENLVGDYLDEFDEKREQRIEKVINDSIKTREISDNIDRNLILRAGNSKEINENNEHYSGLRFAQDAIKDCAAFIMPITSNPNIKVSEDTKLSLANEAIKKGAKVLVSDLKIKDYPCIVVNNVFNTWCRAHEILRSICSPKVIGITGSIGKTTTTEMIYHVVNSKYKTHRNTGSANSVRYTGGVLQQLKKTHEVYVQEIMEGPPFGVASTISKYIKPDISVVTRVASSHIEAFGSQEKITESCFGIEDGMPDSGILVCNADDEYQMCWEDKKHKCITYGIENKNADYCAINIEQSLDKIKFQIVYQNKTLNADIHCLGIHNVLNALAAFAVGKQVGMSDDEIIKALSSYRTSGIRQNMVNIGGQNLFLDCYNASSESIKAAIDSIDLIKEKSPLLKTIAVIGDVLELGNESQAQHRIIGEYLSESKLDTVVCYGNYMKEAYDVLKDNKEKQIYYTENFEDLISYLQDNCSVDDLLIFKGSHGMMLENVADRLFGTWFHEEFERYDFIAKYHRVNSINYTEYSDHVTVTGGSATESGDLEIPGELFSKPVTGIDRGAFTRHTNVKRVFIPDTMKNIRYCSFYKCDALTEVTIPGNVQIVDRSAFSTCENLKKVVIEEGVKELGYRAFGNCKKLKEIYMPQSIINIGDEVLLNCKDVTVYCRKNSNADKYAKSKGIKVSYV